MIFLIASDCFFRGCVVSRCMVSPELFCFFCVGKNIVLNVNIISLKVLPCLFHSLNLVLSQHTIFLPSLLLTCIYLLVVISGVRHVFFQIFYPKVIDYQVEVDWLTVVCP